MLQKKKTFEIIRNYSKISMLTKLSKLIFIKAPKKATSARKKQKIKNESLKNRSQINSFICDVGLDIGGTRNPPGSN